MSFTFSFVMQTSTSIKVSTVSCILEIFWCNGVANMSSFLMQIVAVIVLLAGEFAFAEYYSNYIYVDEMLGENSIHCLKDDNGTVPCRTLEWVLHQPEAKKNSTHIMLSGGSHVLTLPLLPFQNLDTLAISGSRSVITCNKSLSGLMFLSMRNIMLYNLSIQNCGMIINTTSRRSFISLDNTEFYKCYTSLYFYQCINITIDTVDIKGYSGAAGLVFYNSVGYNVITNSIFSGNEEANAPSKYLGLGGVYIEYTYCIPGDVSCNDKKMDDSIGKFNSGGHFLFKGVQFCSNNAKDVSTINRDTFIVPYKTRHNSFGKGGGLALIFKGNASRNQIDIENCHFIQNKAKWGSGLVVEFQDFSNSNTVKVINTVFFKNGINDIADSNAVGGGVRISHYVFTSPDPTCSSSSNSFTLYNCNIFDNTATIGGGISIVQSKMITKCEESLFCLSILNSSFMNNVAQLGAAVEANMYSNDVNGHLLPIVIEDSTFVNNRVNIIRNEEVVMEGEACVYTYAVPFRFQGETVFNNNTGSALIIAGTTVYFSHSNVHFTGNSGKYGGGIQLLNFAYMLVDDNTSISFINNQARMHGGAIAKMNAEKDNFKIYSNCFIRHADHLLPPDDWNAIFTFESNTAMHLGPSIFTESLSPCSWAGAFNNNEIFCWKGWRYYRNQYPSDCNQEISTTAANISINKKFLNLDTFPGKENTLSMTVIDELHNNITSDTILVIQNEGNSVSDVKGYYSEGLVKVRLDRMENTTAKIVLHTAQEQSWHVELEFHIQQCPPGFNLQPEGHSNEDFVCMCSNLIGLECSSSSFEASLKNGYWLGRLNGISGWTTSLCPTAFCYWKKLGSSFSIPSDEEQLNDQVCKPNRMGILCSLCKNGSGISITGYDFDCVSCDDNDTISNIMKYVASVYIPLLVLFLILMIFGIRLTSGPANAFIFYAHTISSTIDLTADRHIHVNIYSPHSSKFIQFYKFIYGIFNLEFIENVLHPFCLSTKLNTLDVLQLNYIIAAFPLLIILTIVVVVKIKSSCNRYKRFKCTSRINVSPSLLHVFSAYLLLSYSKFTLISLSTIKEAHFNGVHGVRVYYAGQYNATDSEYKWRYWTPAWIILVVSSLLPILLFRYPVLLLEKIVRKITYISKRYPADKVHIFLDTFQGCYKDNRRYFAGVYFLFRLIMGILYAGLHDWFRQYLIQLLLCIVLIVVVALLRPYRKEYWYLNYVDLLMFTNLAVVNIFSLYMLNYDTFELKSGNGFRFILGFEMFLVLLPLFYIMAYIFWHLFFKKFKKELRKWTCKWNMKAKMIACRLVPKLKCKDIMENNPHFGKFIGCYFGPSRGNECLQACS